MVPFSHLHIGGTGISRGVQMLSDCIGDRARVSKDGCPNGCPNVVFA